ncbi:MAG TPA: VWA domain-containing protein [Terriglobales bacterium]|nr:VWA domain-containing protein [Terriglobales bacterium]
MLKSSSTCVYGTAILLTVVHVLCAAQNPQFHSEARLVLVDVVASDQGDQPILGLKPEDFKIWEDGKLQQIRFFDSHTLATRSNTREVPRQLPLHVFTNQPEEGPGVVRTIILFDTLNTPTSDQAYARQEMVKFLKLLPQGQSVALFTLGRRLQMVQSFTGISDQLVAAAEKIFPEHSPLVITSAERQSNADELVKVEEASAVSQGIASASLGQAPTTTGNNTGSGQASGVLVSGFTDRLRQFLAESEASYDDTRVRLTVDALGMLARGIAGYPGRKNLLWLSAAFPFSLGPNPELADKTRSMRNYESAIRGVAAELAAERIAVYPIDIRGLMEVGVAISSSGQGETGYTSRGIPQYSTLIQRQNTEIFNSEAAMNDIASQTGGRAFYSSNGLRAAMQRSMERGSNYYTLAYTPQNPNWDGRFRHVEVKVARTAKLEYRHGYFAVDQAEPRSEKEAKQLLLSAVQPGIIDSTMVSFVVQVLPPEKPHDFLRINYVIDPRQIVFRETPDSRKHAMIDLLAVAWDAKNRDAGHVSDTLDAALSPETFKKISESGIRTHQELELKPGSYHLRIGIMDRTNQSIGTLDVPVTVGAVDASALSQDHR